MLAQRYIFLLYLVFGLSSNAQNKQLLFGFKEIPQAVLINPSTTLDYDKHIGIPLLSHLYFNLGSSGVSAYDLFADDRRDFSTKLENVIYSLSNKDFFTVNQQTEIFFGGFAYGKTLEKDNYLSFGMYLEMDAIAYFPKDYAILAYEGNANHIGRFFDASHLNASGEALSVFHIGTTKKINKKLTLGVRGKIYSSIFNINSTRNQGFFVTESGTNNVYRHTFNLGIMVNTSGINSLLEDDNLDISNGIKTLRKRLFFGGNLGLGLDLGITYQASDQLTYEASLQDIGFIRHTKDVERYSINGTYVLEGINPLFPEVSNEQTAEDYWNDVADSFEDLFQPDTLNTKYTTWRPIKLNAALRYTFGKEQSKECDCRPGNKNYINAVGAQLFAINRPKQPQIALTAYYYRRLFNGLKLKATYTVDSFSYKNIGLGMSSRFGPLNFYVTADNLLEYQNLAKAQNVSLQLGFNLIFDKKF